MAEQIIQEGKQSINYIQRSKDTIKQSDEFVGKSYEIKLILADNENFDKKSTYSTSLRSQPCSNTILPHVQFIKLSHEKKSLKAFNSDISLFKNKIENININEANDINHKRRDRFNTIIIKGGKDHKVTFKENFIDRVTIDSFKEINNLMIVRSSRMCSNCACSIY